MEWVVPAERLSRLEWGGILLSFAGIAVTFLWRDTLQHETHQNFSPMYFGDLLALSAGILWAATTVAVRLSPLSEAPTTQSLFYQSSTNHLQATEGIAHLNLKRVCAKN